MRQKLHALEGLANAGSSQFGVVGPTASSFVFAQLFLAAERPTEACFFDARVFGATAGSFGDITYKV